MRSPVSFMTRFVDEIPEDLEPHALYISREHDIAIHLCACGCGTQTVTPTGSDGWAISVRDEAATLSPSILNRPCGAHYFIRDGAVLWT